MYRQAVTSSNISSIGFSNGTLEIEFHNGGIYQYQNVPESIFDNLMSASSHGKYFAEYIKNVYTPIKLN